MNIGFFGDSYVDLNLNFHYEFPDAEEKYSIWAYRLCKHLNLNPVESGLGGSNQFYAIKKWQDHINSNNPIDIAIFTFTWDHRLYSKEKNWQAILSMGVEKKDLAKLMVVPDDIDDIRLGVELYYRYLYNKEQSLFLHEQSISWILELPEKYPDIKFIFLPNTEVSREMAVKNFKNGVLVDFAFETISALEGERVGIDPFDYEKVGHLTNVNHNRFKDLIKNIILNYNTYEDKIYSVDYEQFRID
jgi:hypothetical protein